MLKLSNYDRAVSVVTAYRIKKERAQLCEAQHSNSKDFLYISFQGYQPSHDIFLRMKEIYLNELKTDLQNDFNTLKILGIDPEN